MNIQHVKFKREIDGNWTFQGSCLLMSNKTCTFSKIVWFFLKYPGGVSPLYVTENTPKYRFMLTCMKKVSLCIENQTNNTLQDVSRSKMKFSAAFVQRHFIHCWCKDTTNSLMDAVLSKHHLLFPFSKLILVCKYSWTTLWQFVAKGLSLRDSNRPTFINTFIYTCNL